jgi:tetratricopeptide (TPR) repeat protein
MRFFGRIRPLPMDYSVDIRIYSIFRKNILMHMIKQFSQSITLVALLLCFNLATADEVQDANKLFKQGQQAQALEKLDAVLASKPKDAQARFLKGLIFTEQGKTAEAIKIFTGLTEDYPDLPEPYNNIAVLYAGQGQYEKAKVELEMAIRTHPSYATAHENLGDIYAKMASQAYDRALQLDKSNTGTATKLEKIYSAAIIIELRLPHAMLFPRQLRHLRRMRQCWQRHPLRRQPNLLLQLLSRSRRQHQIHPLKMQAKRC